MQIDHVVEDEDDTLFIPICFHLNLYVNEKDVINALVDHFGEEIKELSARMTAIVEKTAILKEHSGNHYYSKKEH